MLPGYHMKDGRGRANANVQHLREATETEKEPSLETEGLEGGEQRGTGKRALRCLGVRREPKYRCGPCHSARLGTESGHGLNLEIEVGFSKKINIFELGRR